MYSGIIKAYKDIHGVELDAAIIEANLTASPYGVEMMSMADDEKAAYLADKAPELVSYLSDVMNPGGDATGNTETAEGGEKKKSSASEKKKALQEASMAIYNNLSSARQLAVNAEMTRDETLRQRRSDTTELTAVLIARDCPEDWMKGIGKLKPSKPVTEVKAMLEKRHEGSISTFLQSATAEAKTIIPTNAQLQELGKIWVQNKTQPGKEAPDAPDWAKEDNDGNVQAIMTALDSDAGFDVLVAGREDNAEAKAKAWRWNTKGFEVKYLENVEGGETFKTECMSTESLRNFLVFQSKGYTKNHSKDTVGQGLMTAMIRLVSSKSKDTEIPVPKTVVRVTGNNATNKPQTRTIYEIAPEGKQEMTVKSAKSYLVLRLSKDGDTAKWRVSRARLSLKWADGPVWVAKDEFAKIPGLTGGAVSGEMTKSQKENIEDARRFMMSKVINDAKFAADQGLTGYSNDMLKEAERVSQDEAAAYA